MYPEAPPRASKRAQEKGTWSVKLHRWLMDRVVESAGEESSTFVGKGWGILKLKDAMLRNGGKFRMGYLPPMGDIL